MQGNVWLLTQHMYVTHPSKAASGFKGSGRKPNLLSEPGGPCKSLWKSIECYWLPTPKNMFILQLSILKPRPIWRARFTGLPWPHCTPWWCKTSVNLNWLGLLGLAPCRVYSCFTLPEQCRKSKQTGLSLAAVRHRAGQLRIRATGRKQTLFLVGKNNYIRVVQEKIITVVCNFREGKAS